MAFIIEIVALQDRYKERVQEIDAAHAVFVEAIESRYRRELEERTKSVEHLGAESTELANQWLEIIVQSRNDLLHMAEDWLRISKRTAMEERDDKLGAYI